MFGMAAASFILCQLAGKPFRPEPIFSMQVRSAACAGSYESLQHCGMPLHSPRQTGAASTSSAYKEAADTVCTRLPMNGQAVECTSGHHVKHDAHASRLLPSLLRHLLAQAKQYTALLDRLRQREELVYGNTESLDVDVDDVRPEPA